jgi:hypothetical protein
LQCGQSLILLERRRIVEGFDADGLQYTVSRARRYRERREHSEEYNSFLNPSHE